MIFVFFVLNNELKSENPYSKYMSEIIGCLLKNVFFKIYLYIVTDKNIESEYQTRQYSMFVLVNAQIIRKIKPKPLSMYLSVTIYINVHK